MNSIIKDIFLAIMIENYINFINIRHKALEITQKLGQIEYT